MTDEEAERKIVSWFARCEAECIRRGAPSGWTMKLSSMLGNGTHFQLLGAVYEPTSRGKRKGKPNFRKPVPGTEMTFIFSAEEFRAIGL